MTDCNIDVDIDFADRDAALANLPHVPATVFTKEGKVQRHSVGVYFQNVPVNPLTVTAAFDYKSAGNYGYFKMDFLNVSVYREVRDEEHLVDLLNTEPVWELLEEPAMVEQLLHINKHYDVVQKIGPRSIEDLAVVIALIRPGKKHLINRPRAEIFSEIWRPVENADGTAEYVFRRSHSIAYAALITVQMNLLVEKLLQEPVEPTPVEHCILSEGPPDA